MLVTIENHSNRLDTIANTLRTIQNNSDTLERSVGSIAIAVDLNLSEMAQNLDTIRIAVQSIDNNVQPI